MALIYKIMEWSETGSVSHSKQAPIGNCKPEIVVSEALEISSEFHHVDLKNTRSFRLIALKSSRRDGSVCGEIIQTSLDKPPPYEALSYAWGGQERDSCMDCDGKTMLVTANCKAALSSLAPSLGKRLLFVDAICINQSSILEKNHQVQLMGEIYSKAYQVIVWLGQSSTFSHTAFHFLVEVAKLRNVKNKRTVIKTLVQKYESESRFKLFGIKLNSRTRKKSKNHLDLDGLPEFIQAETNSLRIVRVQGRLPPERGRILAIP
jgi:hypothetical protein